MKKLAIRLALAAFVLGALTVGTTALAKRPGGGGGGGTACPDVWDPVVCADGVTYSNQCYADVAKAPKPCTSVGGPVEARQ
jgi:hypothetical protein